MSKDISDHIMKTPPYLKEGNTIGIIATARKISLEEIQSAIYILKSWGLNVKLGETLSKEEHQFAGTDEERIKDFQQMLDDDSVQAILCARGGYGTVRIIDEIDFSKFSQNPKWIIGYSDVTVLHSHIHTYLGIKTIHGTMPIDFPNVETDSIQTLKSLLFGNGVNYLVPASSYNREGESSGLLIGGNLSILYSLRGTDSDLDTDGKILFLEDLDEYLYHIDRMMMNLKRGRKLEKLKGLIIGGMTDMHDNLIPFGKTAYEIISDVVREYDYPVCFDFPAGHLKDKNCAITLGQEVKLMVPEYGNASLSVYHD